MSSISDVTRSRITGYIEVFIEKLVERYRDRAVETMHSSEQYLSLTDTKGNLQPFHAAIVPSEVLRISAFQRGFVTSLGTSFEECARLIALDHHQDAQRSYDVRGTISSDALTEIERQVSNFERAAANRAQVPSLDAMIDSVLRANSNGENVERSYRADLYILSKDGDEYYFEMKSPKPNKDQCLAVTQRILRFHALRNQARPKVRSYFAMAYNPFGNSREDYNWSIAKNYMPYDEGLLIGDEFWSVIGGAGTYQELLEIYQYVGKVKAKYILDSLAFGF